MDMADAKSAQVGNQRAGSGEGKSGVKLKAVGGSDEDHVLTEAARTGAA